MTNWTNTTRARLWFDTVVLVSATRRWLTTTSYPCHYRGKEDYTTRHKKVQTQPKQNKAQTFSILIYEILTQKKKKKTFVELKFSRTPKKFPEKTLLEKMHDFCFTIPYGLVLIVGGVVGYMKKGSTASLGGGVGIGLVLILAGYLSLDAFKKRKNSYLAFVIETGTLFLLLDLVSLCCCKFCVFVCWENEVVFANGCTM